MKQWKIIVDNLMATELYGCISNYLKKPCQFFSKHSPPGGVPTGPREGKHVAQDTLWQPDHFYTAAWAISVQQPMRQIPGTASTGALPAKRKMRLWHRCGGRS